MSVLSTIKGEATVPTVQVARNMGTVIVAKGEVMEAATAVATVRSKAQRKSQRNEL